MSDTTFCNQPIDDEEEKNQIHETIIYKDGNTFNSIEERDEWHKGLVKYPFTHYNTNVVVNRIKP